MKISTDDVTLFVVLAFMFSPWAVGFVDSLWWFFTSHALTTIPWNETRTLMVLFWPAVLGLVIAGVTA